MEFKRVLFLSEGEPGPYFRKGWSKVAWNAFWNKWAEVLGIDGLPNVGVVIIGRGDEQFAIKSLKDGIVGVWKVGDAKSVMSILVFRTANKVWAIGMGDRKRVGGEKRE